MLKSIPVTDVQHHLLKKLQAVEETQYPLVCLDHGCSFSHVGTDGQFYVIPNCIYLDDERTPLKYWFIVRTAEECIELIREFWSRIQAISLDHDLGTEKDGHDVLLWLEGAVHDGLFREIALPKIYIHTGNIVGRQQMEAAVASINRIHSSFSEPVLALR